MNLRKPEIIIKTDGITGTKIFVDGKKLEGVVGFRFTQSYKDNNGLPVLQIDLKATNVTLDAKMIPTLPEPFKGRYLSISSLINSGILSPEMVAGLCRDQDIELDVS